MLRGLILPFRDRWFVMQGGDTLNVNHHMAVPSQWYGVDFAKVGGQAGRELTKNSGAQVEDFFGWGADVLAPIDGTVVTIIDRYPDNPLGTKDPGYPLGNHVLLESNGYFLWLAHLKRGSVCVAAGDKVRSGAVIGACGNSGNSDFPHIHLHATRLPTFGQGQGENLVFHSIDVELTGHHFTNVEWPLVRGLFVKRSNG